MGRKTCWNPMTDRKHIDPDGAAQRPLLGVDATGASHHYHAVTKSLVVLRDGDVEHHKFIPPQRLDEWVAAVEDERGWDDLRLVDGFGEFLAKTIEGAL